MSRGFARQVGILWDAANVDKDGASAQVYLGRDPSVAIFIKNGDDTLDVTFKVECAGDPSAAHGLNNDEDAVDWFPYLERMADDSLAQVSITVGDGETACLDLNTFTPSRIRLVADHSDTQNPAGPITAFTEHYGG